MEFKKLISGAALALMMTACSSDEPMVNTPGVPTFEGDGYVAVSINLPTAKPSYGSRAVNDQFNHGRDYEYGVTDGLLVLFSGTNAENETEADAVFAGAYQLNLKSPNDKPSTQISAEYQTVVKVQDVTVNAENKLYALVTLNYTDVVEIMGTTLIIDEENFTGTFGDFNKKITGKPLYKKNYTEEGNPGYFFMANTPKVDAMGGDAPAAISEGYNMTTLVEMTGNDIYATETAAKEAGEKGEGVEIFVERAVAKTTVKSTVENTTMEGNADLVLDPASVKWALDNIEPTTFIVRNMGNHGDYMQLHAIDYLNNDHYRFAGYTILKTNQNYYRPYWCIDPNYSSPRDYVANTNAEGEYNFVNSGDFYCHENTFNVANQIYSQTTRVVVKAQFTYKGKNDFFTVGNDKNTLYLTLAEGQSFAEEYILRDANIKGAVQKGLENAGINVDDAKLSNYVVINWPENRDEETGAYTVTSITFEDITIPAEYVDLVEKVRVAANKQFPVYAYQNGESFYDLRVKHFGDELTPWTKVIGKTPEAVYGKDPDATAKYLGRYGMVRNNWYDITIGSIKNLGSPVVPSGNVSTSDDNDEDEQWMVYTINILSWAMRTQTVNF